MFHFILPNGSKIDIEGLKDAFESVNNLDYYFLDAETGEIGSCNLSVDKEKIERLQITPRYLEIPKITEKTKLSWVANFAEIMLQDPLPMEDQAVAQSLYKDIQKELKSGGSRPFDTIISLLESDTEGWIHAWAQWCGDCVYEEATKWLFDLPLNIEEKFEADCDCPLCKLLEKGPHSLGDFEEAVGKIKRKENNLLNFSSNNNVYKEAEEKFVKALKKCHMDTFFSVETFKKWLIDEKKYDIQFAPRALFFLEPDEADFASTRELFNTSMEFANVVPRKSLKGKTPEEASRLSRNKNTDLEVMTYSKDPYLNKIEQAHALMAEHDGTLGYTAFKDVVAELLKERIPFFHIFRVYANAAVCCFNSNDWGLGEELLNAALRINPSYDFALRQKERYVDPYNTIPKALKKDKKFVQLMADSRKSQGDKKYKGSIFAKYERFLKEVGISLDYKAQIKITVFKDGERIERNDPCYCGSGKKFKKCHGA